MGKNYARRAKCFHKISSFSTNVDGTIYQYRKMVYIFYNIAQRTMNKLNNFNVKGLEERRAFLGLLPNEHSKFTRTI